MCQKSREHVEHGDQIGGGRMFCDHCLHPDILTNLTYAISFYKDSR